MTTKRRMTVSLVSLVATLLLAIVSVVAVWASLKVSVEKNVTLSYETREVQASVAVSQMVHTKNTQFVDAETKTFDTEETETANVASALDLTALTQELGRIDSNNAEIAVGGADTFIKYVALKFVITNTSTADGPVAFKATLTYTDDSTADKGIKTYVTTTAPNGDTYDTTTELASAGYTASASLAQGATAVEFYVIIAIESIYTDGEMSGDFTLTLESLEHATDILDSSTSADPIA